MWLVSLISLVAGDSNAQPDGAYDERTQAYVRTKNIKSAELSLASGSQRRNSLEEFLTKSEASSLFNVGSVERSPVECPHWLCPGVATEVPGQYV